MTVFTVTIVQGHYEERTEVTLIFSSLEKVQEWKNSYKTPSDSFYQNGREWAQVREIEVDTNEVIGISDSFYIDVERMSPQASYKLDEDLLADLAELKAKLKAEL